MTRYLLNIIVLENNEDNKKFLKKAFTTFPYYNVTYIANEDEMLSYKEIEEDFLFICGGNLLTSKMREHSQIILLADSNSADILDNVENQDIDVLKGTLVKKELLDLVAKYKKVGPITCEANSFAPVSISKTMFTKRCEEYIDLLISDELAVYYIFNESKIIEYVILDPKNIELLICNILSQLLNLFYNENDMALEKISLEGELKNRVSKFIEEFILCNVIDVAQLKFYKEPRKVLNIFKEQESSVIHIECEESIYIFHYSKISNLINEYVENIRPPQLEKNLSKEERILIKLVPTLVLFEGISEVELLNITKSIAFSKYNDGETIYRASEKAYTLDYILSGKVDFYSFESKYIGTLGSKELFGEYSLDRSRVLRSTKVIAQGNTTLLSVVIDMNQKKNYPTTFLKLYENVIRSIGDKFDRVISSHT